ncbi:hypothetical protein [Prauserella muralis]|uniref:Uncharacterized protein n=1 Tax=Prauserella muralis TaxID=588067 RepID=A0A2V4ALI7_9PSEU|nr:hypothetical protein [Prauserella muralis]PXY21127.1 hypothetical protein BAY60_27050 [Prauserella muralis]TWE30215.1 hypothetical protein FHX69_2912 [Prauserella muralis]
MRSSQILEVTATGDVTTRDSYLRTVVLTGGSAASTLTVKAGGSGGTTVLTLKAAIDTTVSAELADAFCGGGIHATLAGTGAVASFVYA